MFSKAEVQQIVAGALFDFAAKLTTMKEPVTFSEMHLSTPAVELLKEFAKSRNLNLNDAAVQDWNNKCNMQPVTVDRYIEEQINLLVGFKIWWKNSCEFPIELPLDTWNEQLRIFDETEFVDREDLNAITIEAVREYEYLAMYARSLGRQILEHIQSKCSHEKVLHDRCVKCGKHLELITL